MKTLRRLAVIGFTAAAMSLAPVAASAQQVLRFATGASPTDIRVEGFDAFAVAVKDFATFEPHYSATLFQAGTELTAIQRGNLAMAIASPQDIAKQIPAFSIFTAGYLVRDPQHLIHIFDGEIGDEMYKLVEEQMGLKVLTVIYGGTRQLNLRGDRKISTPADLAGVKLRMPGTETWQFLGNALGASATPMALGEVYTGLQTGAIDGQDNPLPTVRDSKFYEVTDQIVLTSHTVGMDFFVVSKKVFDALTPEQQQTMIEAARSAFAAVREKQLALEGELAEFFRGELLEVYTPDVDAIRAHVQKSYLESPYAMDWPAGLIDRINAVE